MIEVQVLGLAVDARSQPVILLRATNDLIRAEKVVPVWIGTQEATSIMAAVQGVSISRPLSHDLMVSLLEATDSRVEQVAVTRITEGTFYAEITLTIPSGQQVLDARPSDAIALASRVGAPILVADEVYDEVGVITEIQDDSEEKEAEIAEFRDFVEHIEPEDFKRESE